SIQEYILRSWSLVKMGTTANQKKLFFNLRKATRRISAPVAPDRSVATSRRERRRPPSVDLMRVMRDVAGARHRSHIAADNSSMARSLEPTEAVMTKSTDQPCILTLNA